MIKEAIATLVRGNSLSTDEAAVVMQEIMEGQVTPSQLSAFLTALSIKGETMDEITGLARVMREKALRVESDSETIDIVGTGGDQAGTFNISTTAAFIAAGAGLKVAKHGNRAASSRSGAADVLEALGVRLDLTPQQVSACLEEVGIAFMFAQAFHPAMKYVGPTRREIGIPTVFNILGPLTNPAGAQTQVLGVAREPLLEKMAGALKSLGLRHALVVHGEDGLDEITITGKTHVCELKDGQIRRYTICPEDCGLSRAEAGSIKGGSAADNAAILRGILSGEGGPRRDVVLLNAAAALVAGDKVATMSEGVALARQVLDSGKALAKLEQLISYSRSLA
ncbi:MAG: anthranilate phosphoribosyltransferase [Dehalococcoidia bacterium]|nr:MAG: anthranilate phosphoribosyltransferase [Dehalococcoidia bacterium]